MNFYFYAVAFGFLPSKTNYVKAETENPQIFSEQGFAALRLCVTFFLSQSRKGAKSLHLTYPLFDFSCIYKYKLKTSSMYR